jgi:enediyne biosynthesis protein E4
MQLTERARARRLLVSVSALLTCVSTDVLAGVTFTDIAEGDQAGISYRRIKSPTSALFDAIKLRPVYAFNDMVESPFRSRGAPGVAVLDYDGDGDLDILVTNGPGRANSLYQNQLAQGGGLTFVDVAGAAGIATVSMDATGVCYGDIDNDGDDDLLILGRMEPNKLFINKGDGTFEDFSGPSGLGGGFLGHTSCSMGDIDGDGLLDIIVSNTFDWSRMDAIFLDLFGFNHENQLYLNQGGNVFQDVSESSGLRTLENVPPKSGTISWGVSMVDYDLDGDVDIMHADDQAAMLPSFLAGYDRGFVQIFNNDGSGQFANVTRSAGAAQPMAWMGLSYGDINCDGNMDFFATNIGAYLIPQQGGSVPPNIASSQWFLGNGAGGFAMAGAPPPFGSGLGALVATPFGWGTSMADVDNDGDTDIVFSGGMDQGALIYGDNPGVVLLNDDCTGSFTWDRDATASSAERTQRSEVIGMAVGDLDNDGFVDVVYAASQYAPPDRFPLVPFFRDYSPAPGWGSPFDAVAMHVPTFTPLGTLEFEWAGQEPEDGHLFVLKNSGNANNWVKAKLTGSVGITTGGRSNRSGIGAVVFFTPDGGKRVMSPVLGGSSHQSQNALEQSFGLGTATSGTLEVLWQGGTKNRLYDVGAGERVRFPEIPCDYTAPISKGAYTTCVTVSLTKLVRANVINRVERDRLRASALRAYDEAH